MENKYGNNCSNENDNTTLNSGEPTSAGATGGYNSASYGSSNNSSSVYGSADNSNSAYGSSDSSNSAYASTDSSSSAYGSSDSSNSTYGYLQQPVQPLKNSKKKKKQGGWGSFIGKTVVAALIIGLIGGGTFTGLSYAGFEILGIGNNQSSDSNISDTQNISASSTSTDNSDYKDGTISAVDTASLEAVDVSDVVDAVMPSIVAITNYSTTTYSGMFGQSETAESESAGSGIIVAQDDDYIYIATNNHVVSGAETLTVQFVNDTVVNATVKGTYEAKDLAVVQVAISDIDSDTLSVIKVADIGDSTELEVGETAIAIGNALGYGQSVTTGVISALGREVTVADETTGVAITNDNLIQTDAAINPGNSGGALINSSGQVIGINSAKYSDTSVEGFGFAIPMEDAWPIIEQLISREKVDDSDSAYLGIKGQDISSSVASAYGMPEGVYVYTVVSGSPAEDAGIQAGDIITSFDGQTIYSMEALKELMAYYSAGTEVEVTISRANSDGEYQEQKLTIRLGNANSVNVQ